MRKSNSAPTAGADPANNRNLGIQGLRGVAALAVVLFHAHGWLPAAKAWPIDERIGVLAVALFFAISGMLMAELVGRTEPWRFLSHRIVRIYPLFLILVVAWAVIAQSLGIQRIGFHLLSLTLAPVGGRYYYLGPEWTLVYECSYYVGLFALAAAGLQRHLVSIAYGWLGAIALMSLVPSWDANSMPVGPGILLKAPSIAFAGGLLIPTLGRRLPLGLSVLALAACFLLWPESLTMQRWIAGGAAALIVSDVSRLNVWLPGFPTLGNWSYALYLGHLPAFAVALKFFPHAALVPGVLGALGVAILFGILDVWLYGRLKRAADRASYETRRRWLRWYLWAFCAAIPAALIIP